MKESKIHDLLEGENPILPTWRLKISPSIPTFEKNVLLIIMYSPEITSLR